MGSGCRGEEECSWRTRGFQFVWLRVSVGGCEAIGPEEAEGGKGWPGEEGD